MLRNFSSISAQCQISVDGRRRGYTGHEMINEFGIINMNGRLYDPVLGRFFSPDPYVQFPDFFQSYNRYSYCLNNPLKYTDPSRQLAGTAFLVASSLFHIGSAMLHAHATGGNVVKAGLVSLLSSPLTSFGIGRLYGGTGSIGKELLRAGTHGLASGLAAVSMNALHNLHDGKVFFCGYILSCRKFGVTLPSK